MADHVTCESKFPNVWDYKQKYYCRTDQDCCSTRNNQNGCCPAQKSFLEGSTIELKYILFIVGAVLVTLLLISISVYFVLRRRKRAKYRPTAPPLSELSQHLPYPDTLPSYAEACHNVYNLDDNK